ncbi:uncharacterized protein LOC120211743 [Hibiscus syriacus]|uniref:uncharacterized protein LOC120211743 n=1 Tax=Hibiscus syriacus TaxID=106335 RepID=UPI0019238BD6|nr:uncharacterized protein LOC120211743 [Hibiscus syriacus]
MAAAGGVNRKISAASARARTRRAKQNASFKLPSGYSPPPPKTCGSPDGPPVSASRIKLKDGRHLAYKEHGVPRDAAKYILSMSMALILVGMMLLLPIPCHRHDAVVANTLSPEIVESLGVFIVSFDMPGYGERYLKLQYVSWAALLAPVINYWWPGFPSNLSTEAYYQQLPNDQWALRVSHYAPWLTYWWNTQKWFPVGYRSLHILLAFDWYLRCTNRQQGEYESVHRDLIIGFGTWEFSPMDLENPFPNNEGSVHLWHGDEDLLVLVSLQRYIAQQLPWIQYHELRGAGHIIPHAPWMSDNIVKALLVGENRLHLCGFACTPLMVITNIDTANFSMD